MKKLFIILILLASFFSCFHKKTKKTLPDKDKFFIKDLTYRDFSVKKLSDWSNYINELQLVDSCDSICIIQKGQSSLVVKYYYYSIIDTVNYYSYVYFYLSRYEVEFSLVNYDKKGKYIDDVCISAFGIGRDYGHFLHSNGVFINDSTIIIIDEKGYYKNVADDVEPYFKKNKIDENDSLVFTSRKKSKILLKKDGHILIDTVK